ncbi:hypothetical protein Pcinc_041960 [Petrolisthes cinctipes]|uniref:Uncharacterized protein n=1 Tax=Petrolisthes cinctipes TaxID=88211 RepID=A0AAE1BIG2_PETCI|nr:hypothetical protein Pcinc_041960 [Petrolisthes cinctipes]
MSTPYPHRSPLHPHPLYPPHLSPLYPPHQSPLHPYLSPLHSHRSPLYHPHQSHLQSTHHLHQSPLHFLLSHLAPRPVLYSDTHDSYTFWSLALSYPNLADWSTSPT